MIEPKPKTNYTLSFIPKGQIKQQWHEKTYAYSEFEAVRQWVYQNDELFSLPGVVVVQKDEPSTFYTFTTSGARYYSVDVDKHIIRGI